MPVGSNAVQEVQSALAGERWISIRKPQHLIPWELPHLSGRWVAKFTISGFHLHWWCHQCPCKGSRWRNMYQCRLLQPSQPKVHSMSCIRIIQSYSSLVLLVGVLVCHIHKPVYIFCLKQDCISLDAKSQQNGQWEKPCRLDKLFQKRVQVSGYHSQ